MTSPHDSGSICDGWQRRRHGGSDASVLRMHFVEPDSSPIPRKPITSIEFDAD